VGEVEQVDAFGIVEWERAHQRLENGVGDPAQVPALEAGVVIDADPGQRRDFLTAQTGHTAFVVEDRQPCLRRRQPGSSAVTRKSCASLRRSTLATLWRGLGRWKVLPVHV
jgi:hypothetical protein